jgi:predicted MFS family arabinose efflux permease
VLYALIERSVATGDLTRAFSWEVTVTNAGAALGSAAAGVLISAAGIHTSFAVAAGSAAVGLLVALTLTLNVSREPVQGSAQG